MPDIAGSFQMISGVPVVAPPAEIDVTTCGELRGTLLDWAARGYPAIVVDLTGTQCCDSTGLSVLVRADKQARARGGGLRLVLCPGGGVPRIVTVTGLDRVIPCFASLREALAHTPAATIRPPHPSQARGMRSRAERNPSGPG